MADPGDEAIRLIRIVGGALGILTGIVLLAWPGRTLMFIAVLVGVWLIALGALLVVRALGGFGGKGRPRDSRLLLGAAGLVYLLVGFACLRGVFSKVATLSVMAGLAWILAGVAETAWRTRNSILFGVLTLLAGAAVLGWPQKTLAATATVGGIWLLAMGALQLFLGLYRSKAAR